MLSRVVAGRDRNGNQEAAVWGEQDQSYLAASHSPYSTAWTSDTAHARPSDRLDDPKGE